MRILVSNDDGYFSPGIRCLAEALAIFGEVTVVAPERDRSGASNSLTLDRPLTVRQTGDGYLFVNGTPTDCVHLAVTGLLDDLPDLVVSGINLGANMGDDTIYSGTVAAAMEGFLLGIPAIAVSMTSRESPHLDAAARVATDLVRRVIERAGSPPLLLNVNVPDRAFEALRGIEVTRLGKRHKAEPVIRTTNPRQETVYWIGAAGPGTDFYAIQQGRVSVTPLQIDLTHHEQLEQVSRWLGAVAERPA